MKAAQLEGKQTDKSMTKWRAGNKDSVRAASSAALHQLAQGIPPPNKGGTRTKCDFMA